MNTVWKKIKKRNILNKKTWNITSSAKRDQQIVNKEEIHNFEICANNDTKKNGKGNITADKYNLICSGGDNDKKAQEDKRMMLVFSEKLKNILNTTANDSKIMILVEFNAQDGNSPMEWSKESIKRH